MTTEATEATGATEVTGPTGPAGAARFRTRSGDVPAALVVAAGEVLERRGPAAVTVRAVATRAGVAPMGVYNHFGDKDGLWAAMTVHGFEMLADAVGPTRPDEPDRTRRPDPTRRPDRTDRPFETLRSMGHGYREFALAHPRHYQLMFRGGPVPEPGSATFELLVSQILVGLARDDVVPFGSRGRAEARDLARRVWAVLHGAVSLELSALTEVPDPAAAHDRLLDVLIAGLTTTAGTSARAGGGHGLESGRAESRDHRPRR